MRNYFQFILLLALLSSCRSLTKKSDDKLQYLYRQRISNSNRVIYSFAYTGDFAFSTDHIGMTILDSSLPFYRGKFEELPCSYFATKPTGSYLRMINIKNENGPTTEKDTLLKPIRQYYENVNNTHVDVIEYNGTYGSATTSTGLMEYKFDSFTETADSLIFHNPVKIFGGKTFLSTASFAKGNIILIDSTNADINWIEINQLIIQRDNIYKPTKPLELVPNQPVVGFATYRFYPTNKIKSNSLTDYGIFKRLK